MTSVALCPINTELLASRVSCREGRPGPRVGDFVRFPSGREGRFSHDWDEDIQWSTGGSFYLTNFGGTSFSGGLYPAVHKSLLTLTDEVRAGRFWFFDRDVPRAHSGVDVEAPCRVFNCAEEPA